MPNPIRSLLLAATLSVALAGSAGCSNYIRSYAEYDRGLWAADREFAAQPDAVWQAMLVATETLPVAFTDKAACFVRTQPVNADSLNVFRVGWTDSKPDLRHPAHSAYTVHLTCTKTASGKTRVHVYVREQISIPALRIVPYSDQPKPVLIDVVPVQQIKGAGDSASIGYREQQMLTVIGKILGEETPPAQLKPVSRETCVAVFDDDGSVSDCPDSQKTDAPVQTDKP